MHGAQRGSRILVASGLTAMLLGVLDPLEGSLLVLPGTAAAAAGAVTGKSRYRSLLLWSLAFVTIGVAALWGWSALGGIGGTSGRSGWWGLTIAPYPIGWISGIIGAVRCLRTPRRPAPAMDAL